MAPALSNTEVLGAAWPDSNIKLSNRAQIAAIVWRLVRIVRLHLRRDAITAIGARHRKLTGAVLRFRSWVRDLAIVDQGAHVERRVGYLLD